MEQVDTVRRGRLVHRAEIEHDLRDRVIAVDEGEIDRRHPLLAQYPRHISRRFPGDDRGRP